MSLPKIVFKEMSLEDNIDLVKWTYFEDDGTLSLHYYTLKCFPELETISKDLSKESIYLKIEEIVTKNYHNNLEIITKEIARYNKLWQEYNDKYFLELTKYFDINWPNDLEEISAYVGIIPVFPRYLDDFSFSIGTNLEEDKLIEVCAHETLHFMWFKKWKELYPNTPRKEFDSPYLVWKYSEMVTDPILNNKPFSNMFKFKELGYDSFYELEYKGDKVMDKLRDIYKQDISINEKIKDGFKYIEEVFATINKIC